MASSIGARVLAPRPRAPSIDYFFEEFGREHLFAGARVANPASRNILEKCGFQWSGVELHRFEALGCSSPVDRFRLSRSVWSSLKHWGSSVRKERVSRAATIQLSSRRTPASTNFSRVEMLGRQALRGASA